MLLGFNLLLWTTHVTEEHFPLFGELKRAGYDGVELPLFEGSPEHFARIGQVLARRGPALHRRSPSCPTRRTAPSAPTRRARQGAAERLRWALDCLQGRRRRGAGRARSTSRSACSPATRRPRTSGRIWSRSTRQTGRLRGQDSASSSSLEPLNRFECYVLNTVADAAELVRRVGQPNYGLLYDTFHANIEEKDPVGVIAPAPRRTSTTSTSRRTTAARPGKGHVPFAADVQGVQGRRLRRLVRDRGLRPGAAGPRRRDPRLARLLPPREEVYRFGHDFLRETWAKA